MRPVREIPLGFEVGTGEQVSIPLFKEVRDMRGNIRKD